MNLHNSEASFKTFLILLVLNPIFSKDSELFMSSFTKITSKNNNLSFSARDKVVKQVIG